MPDPADAIREAPTEEAPAAPPNILCIVMDQLRWDHLGCYGNPGVRTPNLDRLAARGVTFERAYVANPLCMPARATFFTGRTPRGHGVRTNGIPLDPRVPTMTEALRQAGYHTHSAGKIHVSSFGIHAGEGETVDPRAWPESRAAWNGGAISKLPSPYYGLESADFVGGHTTGVFGEYVHWIRREHPAHLDAVLGRTVLEDWSERCGEPAARSAVPEELHYNRWIADRTCDFLEAKAKDKRPFFCWCSFPDPHHSYVAPEPYASMYDPAAMPLPTRREGELDDLPPFYRIVHDEGAGRWGSLSGRRKPTRRTDDEIRHIRAMTYGMVTCADAAVGRVLDRLDALELAENTVVVFLADHGDMLGDHWIVNKGPFHFESLLRMPHIWSWPGHFPEGVRTRGLASQIDFAPTVLDLCGVPIPEGETPPAPEAKCQRRPWPGRSLVPVLRGQAKKVRDWVIVENDEDYLGSNLRTFITNRYKITFYTDHEDWGELFDLEADPKELRNLWNDPASKGLKNALLAKFLSCYASEECPLPRRMSHA